MCSGQNLINFLCDKFVYIIQLPNKAIQTNIPFLEKRMRVKNEKMKKWKVKYSKIFYSKY
jgi:hypothetical protein